MAAILDLKKYSGIFQIITLDWFEINPNKQIHTLYVFSCNIHSSSIVSFFASFTVTAMLNYSHSTWMWQTHTTDPVIRGLCQHNTAMKYCLLTFSLGQWSNDDEISDRGWIKDIMAAIFDLLMNIQVSCKSS